jgi:uncharacterized SAM-binding protein YcdF (DUF218 family)
MTYSEPLVFLFVLAGLVGLYRLRRRVKARELALPLAAILGVAAACWMPLAWLLAQPFERWYPRRPAPEGDAQAIVVFSGGAMRPAPERPYTLPDSDSHARAVHAAWLHRKWRPLPVLACGGGEGEEPLAATMARVLESQGVPRQMIWIEDRSTSTYENAAFATAILKPRNISRVALVTSAVHMPRSARALRKSGIEVVAAPCCFAPYPVRSRLLPGWRGLEQNEATLHEAVGLAWYWLRGWI